MSLLLTHPDAKIKLITSNTYRGRKISDIFLFPGPAGGRSSADGRRPSRFLRRLFPVSPPRDRNGQGPGTVRRKGPHRGPQRGLPFRGPRDLRGCLRTPHGERACRTGGSRSPRAIQGKIKGAKLIGNPGCYPIGYPCPLSPCQGGETFEGDIFIDSKSGVSGAGREGKVGSLFCEVSEGFRAYNAGVHRHEPEIQKEVNKYSPQRISFVPHLVPMSRGILTTVYGRLAKAAKTAEVLDVFFGIPSRASLCPDHERERLPRHPVRPVLQPDGDIGLKVLDDGRIIVISTIDNLVKGASGRPPEHERSPRPARNSAGLSAVPQYP